ncbi:MAG TPA: DUF2920 family protein [Rhodocyclaceae bacterium]
MTPHTIEFPAPLDVETGIERGAISADLFMPSVAASVPKQSLPLIVYICPYGEEPHYVYPREKLNPWLAEQFGAVVLCVYYHGVARQTRSIEVRLEGLLARFNAQHEGAHAHTLEELANEMRTRRVVSLGPDYRRFFIGTLNDGYMNFGLLPALDCLQAINLVLRHFEMADPRQVIVYGSSYGGYVGNLMAKLAPNTLSAVIDNAGFARIAEADVLSHELLSCEGWQRQFDPLQGLGITVSHRSPWLIGDETSTRYFSDSKRLIRSLLPLEHWVPSETHHVMFHSRPDVVAPFEQKRKAAEVIGQRRKVNFFEITESDLSGGVFKNLDHGMSASLRKLFALTYQTVWNGQLPRRRQIDNDFTGARNYCFDCGLDKYIVNFSPDRGVELEIRPTQLTETSGP